MCELRQVVDYRTSPEADPLDDSEPTIVISIAEVHLAKQVDDT